MIPLHRLLRYLDTNLPAFGYVVLTVLVIWSLWLLLFLVSAADAAGAGLGFLGVGIILGLLHLPLGWLQFNIWRFPFGYPLWVESKQEAQALYLALGLALIGIGCVYLIRSIV